MKCATCGGALTLLLVTWVCDRCAAQTAPASTSRLFDLGYIVWRRRPPGSAEHVFKTRADAEAWRSKSGLDRFPIRRVLSRSAFKWRRTTGGYLDVETADRLYEIFPDGAHEPGPFRAFLDT